MDCTIRTVGRCALLAVRTVTALFPARLPRFSVATAFLSPSIFFWLHKATFGRLVAARGFQKKINMLLQQVCSFCNAKTVFAQAIVFVTRAFASDVIVMN